MPRKPKKPCSCPGCPNLTDGKYCDVHRSMEPKPESRKHNGFYYTSEWRKARKEYLLDHPECVICGRSAEIVDHIVPLKDGGAELDERNLQSLCWSCHSRKSIEDGSRFRRKVYRYEKT